MLQIICVAQEEEGGGKGNDKHGACEICKSLIFLLHKSPTVQQVPRVRGHCNSSSHRCHPSTCSCGLQLKILPAKEGCKSSCPHCHWSMQCIFYSRCCFSPPVGLILWVSTAAMGIWGECTAFLQALLSALWGSGKWHKPCFTLCPCLLGLSLITRQKKVVFFLSVLVLQIRLVSTCLLGRGELCSKLCGCRLWRNNNIAYHLTYNVIHPSLLLQKALRSCF